MSDDRAAPIEADLPLSDVRIVDFSRLLPGPWATQMLADLGADVIKVERPGSGDPSRHNPPLFGSDSCYFLSVNGNKRFLGLELGQPEGQSVVRRLFEWADVAIDGFRVGVTADLGIDDTSARTANPGIIHCSITGFGEDGPWSGIAGHDLAIQAMAGVLEVSGQTMPSFLAADYAAGAVAAIGILAALRRRDRTGQGCHLDLSMHDCLFAMGNISLAAGLVRRAGGSGSPGLEVWGANPRYDIYPTRDGKRIAVCLLETRLWAQFCEAIGRTDLIGADESLQNRLSTHGEHSALYREAIAAYCLSQDRDTIAAAMASQALPVVPVHTAEEAVSSRHAVARNLIQEVEHPTQGAIPLLRNPLERAGLTRGRTRLAQRLGRDTDDVLAMLGLPEAERDQLRAMGVVSAAEG